MRITVYGRSVVIKMLVLTLLLDIAAFLIPAIEVKLILLVMSILLFAFTLFFFRDPVRRPPDTLKPNEVLSPADGKVFVIEEVEDDTYLRSKAKLIGIFLSPLNVHVNRIPLSGKVEHVRYIPGKFTAAYGPRSSDKNERTEVGIAAGKSRIMFKQVAGFVARRIVCGLKPGDSVRAGEKFGMIKFGSRVDLILPGNTNIKVSLKQKVVGGVTVVAEVPE